MLMTLLTRCDMQSWQNLEINIYKILISLKGIVRCALSIGNDSVPKMIINDTVKFFSKTATNFSVISNHNSFRVLFDKSASVYFI